MELTEGLASALKGSDVVTAHIFRWRTVDGALWSVIATEVDLIVRDVQTDGREVWRGRGRHSPPSDHDNRP